MKPLSFKILTKIWNYCQILDHDESFLLEFLTLKVH